jgi:DinB superfamily
MEEARTKHSEEITALGETIPFLERAFARFPPDAMRTRPRGGGFSFVEQLWHLADLEREGYGVRIRRIRAEDEPVLPDFDGDRIARERRYPERDPREGLDIFRSAREKNLSLLSRSTAAEFARSAVQEEVGRVTLADVQRMMYEHDKGHASEIEDLLRELAL